MTDKNKTTMLRVSKKAANHIENDIFGRSGGDYWLHSIDDETREEMHLEWAGIIMAAMMTYLTTHPEDRPVRQRLEK